MKKRRTNSPVRKEQLFLSLVALLMGFSLLFGGIFCLLFPAFVIDKLALVGGICLGAGTLLLILFTFLSRRRYFLLKMGEVAIHEALITEYAKTCLDEIFPNRKGRCEVVVRRDQTVEILAKLPYLSEEGMEKSLEEVEKKLTTALQKNCGYTRPFIFNVQLG
ncbi:MAG: hypothetical protein K940chlam9_01056 [Chlamydiae bacterium]|nr:hypothetical protein [Chlamydiota bacterium]